MILEVMMEDRSMRVRNRHSKEEIVRKLNGADVA